MHSINVQSSIIATKLLHLTAHAAPVMYVHATWEVPKELTGKKVWYSIWNPELQAICQKTVALEKDWVLAMYSRRFEYQS